MTTTDFFEKLEDVEEDPIRDYGTLAYWRDERLVQTYRRLSYDLRRRGFEKWTVHRMGCVEEELRERDLDPEKIAKEVAKDTVERGKRESLS